MFLSPQARLYAPAKKAIAEADYIIFCPGSFYTSMIASILPRGTFEAIKKSRARLIYPSGNGYITNNETGPEILSGFVKELERYLPRPLDLVIYNSHRLNKKQIQKYRRRHWAIFPADTENLPDHKVLKIDYERDEGGLCAIKLGKIFKKILT